MTVDPSVNGYIGAGYYADPAAQYNLQYNVPQQQQQYAAYGQPQQQSKNGKSNIIKGLKRPIFAFLKFGNKIIGRYNPKGP